MKGLHIDFLNDEFVLKSPYDEYVVMLCKSAPERSWHKQSKTWRFPLSLPNINHLRTNFPTPVFSPEAVCAMEEFSHAEQDTQFPHWYEFPREVIPRPYQQPVLDKAWNKTAFGLFWEMRLGKTFIAVTLASAYHQAADIKQVLVVCPNSIKDVWRREFHMWAGTAFELHVDDRGKPIKWDRRGDVLRVVVVGVESLSGVSKVKKALPGWVDSEHTMLIVDESSRVKNPKAKRSEYVADLSARCRRRLIMTGTPITQGMQDLYMQFRVLDPNILGYKSFYTFRNRYCVMEIIPGAVDPRGNPIERIAGYQNTEELLHMVANYTDTKRAADVWADLPDRVYEERWLEPTREQVEFAKRLKDEMRAEYQGEEITIENTLERMTRYQQLAGGNFPFKDGVDSKGRNVYNTKPLGVSPKLEEAMSIIEDLPLDTKVIVWCRFQPEIKQVVAALRDRYGDTVSEFHGGNRDTRDEEKWAFQDGPNRFFVGNPATGGMGLELSAAGVVIYLSNTFSYEDRSQSEARAQHMDKKDSVVYIDIYVKMSIDRDIANAQRLKTSMANYVNTHLQGKFDE